MNGDAAKGIQVRSERVNRRAHQADGLYYIYVRIYLEDTGSESVTLDDIDYVIYRLHPSFKERRLQRSNKRESGFEIRIWTFGWFYILATIVTKKGPTMEIQGKVEFKPTPEEEAANGPEEFRW